MRSLCHPIKKQLAFDKNIYYYNYINSYKSVDKNKDYNENNSNDSGRRSTESSR